MEIDQVDDLSEVGAQSGECLVDGGIERSVDMPRLRGVVVAEEVGVLRRVGIGEEARSLLSPQVDVGVAQDRQQPGPRIAAVEGVDRAKRAQEGFLDEILGIGRRGAQRASNAEEQIDFGQHEPFEGRCSLPRGSGPRGSGRY